MEKLNYDSLYKFIVSIGIIIMALPFIFLFLILSGNDIVLVSQENINQLTVTAQEIIQLEQNYKHIILSNPIQVCITIFMCMLIGGVIVVYGIIKWNNKVQKYEDKSRELSNELLEKQIKSLTPEERARKVKEEVKMIEIGKSLNNSDDSVSDDEVKTYRWIEQCVYKAIRRNFKNYKIFEEVKIEQKIYDCIALEMTDYSLPDYIFEIKYFANIGSVKNKIKELIYVMKEQKICYFDNTRRYPAMVLIIIVKNIDEKEMLANRKFLDEVEEENKLIDKIIITNIEDIDKELKKIRSC